MAETVEWINMAWYIQTIENCTAMKKTNYSYTQQRDFHRQNAEQKTPSTVEYIVYNCI